MQKRQIVISDEETIEILHRAMVEGKSKQERRRSHALILSDGGMGIREIASSLDVSERSVYLWLNAWDERGLKSLLRKKGDGRRPLLKVDEHKAIIAEHMRQYPHQPKKAYKLTLESTQIEVSYKTFYRFLKKHFDTGRSV